jgi:hypothetical protein
MDKARIAIDEYCQHLIRQRQYDCKINYFEKMKLDYDIHYLKVWKFDKYSGVKDEYKEILKPYMN